MTPTVSSKDVVIIQRSDDNTFYGEAHISGALLIPYLDATGHINAANSASFYALFSPSGSGGGSSTLQTGSTYPITSSWADNLVGGTTGLQTGSDYPITASWADHAVSASYVSSTAIGGLAITFEYKFDTSTVSSDPGSGRFRYNSSTTSSITNIYLDAITNTNLDISELIQILASGSFDIYIQDKDDSTRASLFKDTSIPTNNGGWFTIPVQHISSAPNGIPTNNSICSLFLYNKTTITTGATYNITASSAVSSSYASTSSAVNVITASVSQSYFMTFVPNTGSQTLLIDTTTITYDPFSDTLNTQNISCSNLHGTSSQALSSSHSETASFVLNAGSTLQTGSTYPFTSSWSNNAVSVTSASFASSSNSSSVSISSSYAVTASFATNAGSSTSLQTGSTYPITASSAVSSSNAQTSSWAINLVGGTSALQTGSTYPFTSSFSVSGSHSSLSDTSSFVYSNRWINYRLEPTTFAVASSTLPAARGSMVHAIVGNKIYLYGGRTSGGSPQVNIYTASTDSPLTVGDAVTTLPTTMGTNAGRLLIISGTMYWYGGVRQSGGSITNAIYTASVSDPLTWGDSTFTQPGSSLIETSMWIHNGLIYLAWGGTSKIYTASVSNPLVWDTNGTNTITSTSQLSVIQVDNTLIAVGGTAASFVFSASADSPFNWGSASTSIPGGSPNNALAIGNRHWVLGGGTGGTGQSAEIYYLTAENPAVPIDTSGSTGQVDFSSCNLVATMSNGTPYLAMYGGSTGDSSAGRNTIITASITRISSSLPESHYKEMKSWESLNGILAGPAFINPDLTVSSSFASSSLSSSYAVTASFVSSVVSSSFATTSSFATRGGTVLTASVLSDASSNPIFQNNGGNLRATLAGTTTVFTIAKNGGAASSNTDTNAVLVLDSANNATNFWFNVGTGAGVSNATFGFTQGGTFRHGITWNKPNNWLAITHDGSNGTPNKGLFVGPSGSITIGKPDISGSNSLDVSGSVVISGSLTITGSGGLAGGITASSYSTQLSGSSTTFIQPIIQAGTSSVVTSTTASIIFKNPMPTNAYAILLTPSGSATTTNMTYVSQSNVGFTASFDSFTGTVSWLAAMIT